MNDTMTEVLGLKQKRREKFRRYRGYGLAALVLLILLLWWLWPGGEGHALHYQTAEVYQGDLTVTVTATGILQPLNQVDVGTEISGTVQSIEADFNDRVSAGQVLARLDTKQLAAKLRQAEAALQLARAMVRESEATVLETRTSLNRARELEKQKLGSRELLDSATAAYARAQAALERSKAQVTQAEAQLDADRTTLSKTEIRSPINGIVLKRQIEPGQTVAASLQTPILFTLAENLTQMELHVAVDEADVGLVREGQNAIFRVDAFQQRSFPASISQVRFAPQTIDGVVTYETVLSVNNEDLALRPGMTATAEIIVQQLDNVLLAPNTALRFSPPNQTRKPQTNLLSQLFTRRPSGSTTRTARSDAQKAKPQQLWRLQDGEPVALEVKVGATNGQVTQITAGDVTPGMPVIVDTISTTK
ncbi:MAG: efflux RND transporter periplasmic adaptor subunit [Gammaproteobacteria bacterium]